MKIFKNFISEKAAGLEIVTEVLTTESVLIRSKHCKYPDIVDRIKQRIQGYLTATKYGSTDPYKYQRTLTSRFLVIDLFFFSSFHHFIYSAT